MSSHLTGTYLDIVLEDANGVAKEAGMDIWRQLGVRVRGVGGHFFVIGDKKIKGP